MDKSAKLKLGGGGVDLLDTSTILYGKAQFITNIDYKSIELNKLIFQAPLQEISVRNENFMYETHISIMDGVYYTKNNIDTDFQQKLIPNLGIRIIDNSNISVNFDDSGWINNETLYTTSNIGIGTSIPEGSLHIYNKNNASIIIDNTDVKFSIGNLHNFLTFGNSYNNADGIIINNNEQFKIHQFAPNNSLYIDYNGDVKLTSNIVITGSTTLSSEIFIENDNIINWLGSHGLATNSFVKDNNYMTPNTIIKGTGENITNIDYNNIKLNKLYFNSPLFTNNINGSNNIDIDLSLSGWTISENNNIYTTLLNSKIGIGTTSPLASLHIGSTSYTIGTNNNNNGSIIISKSTSTINNNFKIGYDDTNDNFNFALGNFKIDTLEWIRQLYINNNAPESSLIINNIGDIILNNSLYTQKNIYMKGAIYIINSNNINTNTNNYIIKNENNNLIIGNNNNKHIIINNSGFVGFGTIPVNTFKLSVEGSIKISDSINTNNLITDTILASNISLLNSITISSNLISQTATILSLKSTNIENINAITTNSLTSYSIISDIITSPTINSTNSIIGNNITATNININNLLTTLKLTSTNIISKTIVSDSCSIQTANFENTNINNLNTTNGIITTLNTINATTTNLISSIINNSKLISSSDINVTNNINSRTLSTFTINTSNIYTSNIYTSNIIATQNITGNTIDTSVGSITKLTSFNIKSNDIQVNNNIISYTNYSTICYTNRIGINIYDPLCELHIGMSTTSGKNSAIIIEGPSNRIKMGYDNTVYFSIGKFNASTNLWTQQLNIHSDTPANTLILTSTGCVGINTTNVENVYKLNIYGSLNANEIYQNGVRILTITDVNNSITSSLTPYLTTIKASETYPTNYQVTTLINSSKLALEGNLTTLLTTYASIYSEEKRFPLNSYDSYQSFGNTATFYNQTGVINIYSYKNTFISTVYNSDNTISTYTYEIYTSSQITDKYLLFNYEKNNFTHNCSWNTNNYETLSVFSTSSFDQNFRNNTIFTSIINGGTTIYLGDFIIMKSPIPITLTRFRFYISNLYKSSAPGLWKCYGSNDCAEWTEIINASYKITTVKSQLVPTDYLDTGYNNTNSYYEQLCDNKLEFNYIGFVFNKLVYIPPNTIAKRTLRLSRIEIFGKETITPIYVTSNVLNNYLSKYATLTQHNTKQDAITCISPLYLTNYNEIGIDPTFILSSIGDNGTSVDDNVLTSLSNALITYVNTKADVWNINPNGSIYITNTNVGIGTTIPNYNLDVNGTINAALINLSGNIIASSYIGDGALLTNIDYTTLINKPSLNNLNNWLYNSVVGNCYINPIITGNVGIGYTNGASLPNKFSVNGSIYSGININAKNNLQENNINLSDKYLTITTANNTYLKINGGIINGAIGIGIDPSSYKLNVEGSINISRNINASNFIENGIDLSSKYLSSLNANNTYLSKITGGTIQNNLTIYGALVIGSISSFTDKLSVEGPISCTDNIKTRTNFIENGCNLIDKYLTITTASNIYLPFSGGVITSNLTIVSNMGVGILASTDYTMNINGPLNINSLYINNVNINFDNYVTKSLLISSLSSYPTFNYLENNYISSNVILNYLAPYDKIVDRNNAITNLENIYISSNVIVNYLAPYDKIIDRTNAITNLANIYISSNQFYNYTDERLYPPTMFDNYTDPVQRTFINQAYNFYETITLSTATYGNGLYEIWASTGYGLRHKRNMFNNIYNDAEAAGWDFSYDNSNGYYTGNKYIVNDYKGNWFVIKFPVAIILTKFRFYWKQTTRAPGLWRCYGSNDGINYVHIPDASNDINYISHTFYSYNSYYEKTLPSIFQIPYLYIGWCINKLAGNDGSLIIGELLIFGKELIEPIYVSSTVLTNKLLVYDKIIDRQNEINNLANIYTKTTDFNNKFLLYSTTGNDPNYLKLIGGSINGKLISSNITNSNLISSSNFNCSNIYNSNQLITNSIVSKTIISDKININTINDFNNFNLNVNGAINTSEFYINGSEIKFNTFASISSVNSSLQLYPTLNYLSDNYLTCNLFNTRLLSYSPTGTDPNYLKLTGNGLFSGNITFTGLFITTNLSNVSTILTSNLNVYSNIQTSNIYSSNIINSNLINTNLINTNSIITNNIGIGTTISILYKLNINGSIYSSNDILCSGNFKENNINLIDKYLTINNATNTYFPISGGIITNNVGISTNPSLSHKLLVNGSIFSSNDILCSGNFKENNTNLIDKYLTIQTAANVYLPIMGGSITNNLSITGTVGIGTTASGVYRLNVKGPIYCTDTIISTTDISENGLKLKDKYLTITNANSSFLPITGGIITNLGIGTSISDVFKLNVNGSIYSSNNICSTNFIENGSNLQDKYLTISNANISFLPITGGVINNIGIGTSISDVFKLNVNGSIYSSNNICSTNFIENGTKLQDKYLTISNANISFLPITGGVINNIGIGTTVSQIFKLNVNGSIYSSNNIYAMNFIENGSNLQDKYLTVSIANSSFLPISGGIINNNIGIGTTPSELYKLTTNGSIYSSNNIYCSSNFVENGVKLVDKYLSITNASGYILNSEYLKSELMNNQPNLQKKNGFRFSCTTEIKLNNETYYKHDIDLTNYVKNKTDSIDTNPYRIFGIKCFSTSAIFNSFTANKPPNILQYDIYMSRLIDSLTNINVCAVGFPSNYYLNKITSGDIFLLKTNNYNYISILSKTYNLSVSCIISDFLF
jgi:hypothetical protein